jgi:hypothetical protein
VQGMEGDIILLQDLFHYRTLPGGERGKQQGELVATGLRPKMLDKLAEQNIEVPAAAFKAPAGSAPGRVATTKAGRGGKVRVPSAREIAEREQLR